MSTPPSDKQRARRVMVVEQDSCRRQALADALGSCGWAELVGTAVNARTAGAKVAAYDPEVVLVGGLGPASEAVRCASEMSSRGFEVLLSCRDGSGLEELLGDPRVRQIGRVDDIEAQLEEVVMALGGRRRVPAPTSPPPKPSERPAPTPMGTGVVKLCVVAASTGGPEAVQQVLPRIPASFPVPMLVVQHLPAGFTASMAQSLDAQSALQVREARAREPLRSGAALIAPGGMQTLIRREGGVLCVDVCDGPRDASCRPNVDLTLESVEQTIGGDVLVVMMTGMGSDGTAGCARLRPLGARIVAQDEATSTVWGMPRGPIEQGLVDVVAPLEQIAAEILGLTAVGSVPKGR